MSVRYDWLATFLNIVPIVLSFGIALFLSYRVIVKRRIDSVMLFMMVHLAVTLVIYCVLQARWIIFGFENSAFLEKAWAVIEIMFRADIGILLIMLCRRSKC